MNWLRQSKLGFTLIELLIVIFIIAMMATVVIQVLIKQTIDYTKKPVAVEQTEQGDNRLENLP